MPNPIAPEETMAQYKTIALELIQEQPEFHEQLRASRTLLQAVNDYATALRTVHRTLMEELTLAKPGIDPAQLSSEALEMAIQDLRDHLPSSRPTDVAEPLSLDAAMTFLRRHTPPA